MTMSEDTWAFIRMGLGGLVADIPELIRDARLQLKMNDVAIIVLVDPDAQNYYAYYSPRDVVREELVNTGIGPEIISRFDPPKSVTEVPVLVGYRDETFAFQFRNKTTDGTLN